MYGFRFIPRLAAITLATCLVAPGSHARPSVEVALQSPTTVTSPVVQPTPVISPDLSTSITVPPSLVGRWSSSNTDKETGVTETLVIEFKQDGTYTTQLRDSHFKPPRFQSTGRYVVMDATSSGFTLGIERRMADPESDKAAAKETQRITWVDRDTMRAADGSVVRRVR